MRRTSEKGGLNERRTAKFLLDNAEVFLWLRAKGKILVICHPLFEGGIFEKKSL